MLLNRVILIQTYIVILTYVIGETYSVILTYFLHVMSQTYIGIFLPNYIVVLLTKSIHITVNNITIQQNAI